MWESLSHIVSCTCVRKRQMGNQRYECLNANEHKSLLYKLKYSIFFFTVEGVPHMISF